MKLPPVKYGRLASLLTDPKGTCDVVIDTDTYNEVDDQFAIMHALMSKEFNIETIQAAPFHAAVRNTKSHQHGMEMSYEEINRILEYSPVKFTGPVLTGSKKTLTETGSAVDSEASRNLVERGLAKREGPLYIVALGALTNVASAIMIEPSIRENVVVIALGGWPYHVSNFHDFNFIQDIEAAKFIFESEVALVQVPGFTVSELLRTTRWEMSQYVKGRGKIGDYLFELYEEFVQDFPGRSKAIWDLAPGAWIINSEWMKTEMTTSPILNDHLGYSRDGSRHPIKVVNWLDRDQIFKDFFTKLHNVTN